AACAGEQTGAFFQDDFGVLDEGDLDLGGTQPGDEGVVPGFHGEGPVALRGEADLRFEAVTPGVVLTHGDERLTAFSGGVEHHTGRSEEHTSELQSRIE